MGKYAKRIAERVRKGSLPVAYDPYNRTDVTDVHPTITTLYGVLGRPGTAAIFEESRS